jgi:ABC-type transport system involved in Fe-S cluster assembly fused permease/ATPase subunit
LATLQLIPVHATQDNSQRRTTLVIAHRLLTVQKSDKIVVLERGAVVEVGTHLELVAKPDGAYRQYGYVVLSRVPDGGVVWLPRYI